MAAVAGLAQSPAPPRPESLRAFIQRSQYRQAYGIYLGDRKVGWALAELKLGTRKNREAALDSSQMHIRVLMGGEPSQSDSTETDAYALEEDGALVEARERQTENKVETRRTVQRQGDHVVITTRVAGLKTVRRMPLPKENLEMDRALERWLRTPPALGERFESWSTDWGEDDINRRETYTYKGRRTAAYDGAEVEVSVVSLNTDGMEMECLLLPTGQMFQGQIGGLFALRAEPLATAKDLSRATPVDYLEALAIKVDQDLGFASRVEKLSLEVRGLGSFKMPSTHRQVVQSDGPDRVRIELRRDFRVDKSAPLTAPQRRQFLQSTVAIQANDKTILALARRITEGETEPVKAAEKMVAWMQGNLKQVQGANAATAREVLRTKTGDCTEHSLLFVTLARASGIPARPVGGVAFAHEHQPRFYWHEWAEIHDGRQWVTIDPTWNEIYIDATHLEFTDNIEDWSWVNLLGRLSFQVIDFERQGERENSAR
jgi:transglutaminase-like putative cysteine protease